MEQYSGPPPMAPPARGPVGVPAIPDPPRLPPRQDHRAIDEQEATAEELTHRFAIAVGIALTTVVLFSFVRWAVS